MSDDLDRPDADQEPDETPDAPDTVTDEGQEPEEDVTTDDPAELQAAIKRLKTRLKAVNAESAERRLKLKEIGRAHV